MKNNRYAQLKTVSVIKNTLMESAMGWKQHHGCYPTVSQFSQKINELFDSDIFSSNILSNTEELNETHINDISVILTSVFEQAENTTNLQRITESYNRLKEIPDLLVRIEEGWILRGGQLVWAGTKALPQGLAVGTAANYGQEGGKDIATALDAGPATKKASEIAGAYYGEKVGIEGLNLGRKVFGWKPKDWKASLPSAAGFVLGGDLVDPEESPWLSMGSSFAGGIAGDVTGRVVKKGLEKTAETSLGKAVTKATVEPVVKTAEKVVGKQALKVAGKKIPFGVGAALATGLAIDRATRGDWFGAGGEVLSGLASTVPFAGTATSAGIDAALAAKDIQDAEDEEHERLRQEDEAKGKKALELMKSRGMKSKEEQDIEARLSGALRESYFAKRQLLNERGNYWEAFLRLIGLASETIGKALPKGSEKLEKEAFRALPKGSEKLETGLSRIKDAGETSPSLERTRSLGPRRAPEPRRTGEIFPTTLEIPTRERSPLGDIFTRDLERQLASLESKTKELGFPVSSGKDLATTVPQSPEPQVIPTDPNARPKDTTSLTTDTVQQQIDQLHQELQPSLQPVINPITKTATATELATKTKTETETATKTAIELATKPGTALKVKTELAPKTAVQTALQKVSVPQQITGTIVKAQTKVATKTSTATGQGIKTPTPPTLPGIGKLVPEFSRRKSGDDGMPPILEPMGDVRYPALRSHASYGVLPVYEGVYNPKSSLQKKSEKQKYKIVVVQEGGKKVEIFASTVRGIKRAIFGKTNYRIFDSKGTDISNYFKKVQKKGRDRLKGK